MKSGMAGYDLDLDELRWLLKEQCVELRKWVEYVDTQRTLTTDPEPTTEPESHKRVRRIMAKIESLLRCAEGRPPE